MSRNFTEADREKWVAWLNKYGARQFLDAFMRNAHGARSICRQCGSSIFLDLLEGGGVVDWRRSDGDYGCNESPESGEDGVGGHLPVTGGDDE